MSNSFQVGLMALIPSVVDAVKAYKIPVIAAGGIVDGRGYVAALALGAQGVCMGTRYLPSKLLFLTMNAAFAVLILHADLITFRSSGFSG